MGQTEWGALNHQHFGDICFGNGGMPLTSLIVAEDLDRDLYFVIWEPDIIRCIHLADVNSLELDTRLVKRLAVKVATTESNDTDRFNKMQDVAADVGFDIEVHELIGSLYDEAKAEWKSGRWMVYKDYVAL